MVSAESLFERFTLALVSLPGIGRKTARAVLQAEKKVPNFPDEFLQVVMRTAGRRGRKLTIRDADVALQQADQIIAESSKHDIQIVCISDDQYPFQLREIDDPPVIIFVKGDRSVLMHTDSIAIVGTRHPTDFGKNSARRIGGRLAEEGIAVVSGLAQGCDTSAHEGCIASAGRTIAVLAHGLDMVYPKSNAELAERILEQGGTLVSEYPIKTEPQRNYYAERDRIQSALSKVILVIETDLDGGTMHTVRFAQKQGRQLACLVHPSEYLDEPSIEGNRMLLRDGLAFPVADPSDLRDLICRARELIQDKTKSGEHHQVEVQSPLWSDES